MRATNKLPLPALLSQLLVAFTIEFDNEFERQMPHRTTYHGATAGSRSGPWLVSLVMWSNCMQFVVDQGVRLREVRLTSKGREAQEAYSRLLGIIEDRWIARFGGDTIGRLRESLEQIVGEPTADLSRLFSGLKPYHEGWRASVPKPATLPHFPMVLHRGGFPDGS
jgi:hypothetical protein